MSKLKLTSEQIRELWDVDVEEGTIKHKFNNGSGVYAGDDAAKPMSRGYLRISKRINGKYYQWLAHHIIWVVAGNDWPGKYEVIHHKDNNPINNKIDNLILLSASDHVFHHTNTPEDLRFIHWNSINQNWMIQITINHKKKYFGSYKDIEDAKTARDEILKSLSD